MSKAHNTEERKRTLRASALTNTGIYGTLCAEHYAIIRRVRGGKPDLAR